MLKERERDRINRRGKYTYVEKIDDITNESDHVDFNGKVFSLEVIERGDRKRLNFGVADEFGGAISCNMYQNLQVNDELVKDLLHANVRIRGAAYVDEYDHNLKVKS
jgi:DNA polymerase III alpha subunit (gram-positive type)